MTDPAGPPPASNVRAVLFALAGYGLFATHDAIVKTLGATYSPFQIVFFIVLFGFPLTTLFLLNDRTEASLLPRHPFWMAGRSLAAVMTGVCAFYAFTVLPLTQVYAVLFAAPLLITVLSIPVLGETVRFHRWVAVLVGLCGVIIALQPGAVDLKLGHAAALLAAFSGAFGAVVIRKIGPEERPVVMMLYPMAANFVLMAVLLPFVYKPLPLADLGAMAGASAIALCAMLCTIYAFRLGSASVVAPMQYSQIIWATAYGAVFFGEALDVPTGVGAAIVIASGLYVVLRERYGGNSLQTPVLRARPRFETGTVVAARVSQTSRAQHSSEPAPPAPASAHVQS